MGLEKNRKINERGYIYLAPESIMSNDVGQSELLVLKTELCSLLLTSFPCIVVTLK